MIAGGGGRREGFFIERPSCRCQTGLDLEQEGYSAPFGGDTAQDFDDALRIANDKQYG